MRRLHTNLYVNVYVTRYLFLTLVFAALALAPAEPLRAQAGSREAPGTLEGTVTNDKGAPVAGARILWQTADGRNPRALRANAHGHFRIGRIPPGLYQVRAVTKKTSSEWSLNVVVRPGQQASVTLRLEPPPSTAAPNGAPAATPARPKPTPVAKPLAG